MTDPCIFYVFSSDAYMNGVCMLKPWPNSFFIYFGSLFLNATFMAWNYDDMLVKMQWLFLEVRILWYVWEIMSL